MEANSWHKIAFKLSDPKISLLQEQNTSHVTILKSSENMMTASQRTPHI
jgi:hypothetical protein